VILARLSVIKKVNSTFGDVFMINDI